MAEGLCILVASSLLLARSGTPTAGKEGMRVLEELARDTNDPNAITDTEVGISDQLVSISWPF